MEERRWLEIERRLQWCELKTRTVEDILRFAYEKSNQIWDSLPPPDGGGTPPDPGNPCENGVSWFVNSPGYSVAASYTFTGGCDQIPTMTGTVFYDTPWAFISRSHTMTYDGIQTEVYRAEIQCVSNSFQWVTVLDKTNDPLIQPIHPYDPLKSITLCYKYEFNTTAKLAVSDTSIGWIDSAGDDYANRMYYAGDLSVSVDPSGSPAEKCSTLASDDIKSNCQAVGPTLPIGDPGYCNLIVGGSVTGPDVDTVYPNKFRFTPIDYEIIPLAGTGYYTDNSFTETYIEGLIQTFLNEPLNYIGPTSVCSSVIGAFEGGAEKTYDCKTFKINPGYTVVPASISGIRAARVMDVARISASCSNTDVASTLPPNIRHTATNPSVRPYSIVVIGSLPDCTPSVPQFSGFDMSGSGHPLVNFTKAPFTYQSEEWWTPQLTGYTTRRNEYLQNVNGRASYRIKWKFEGPL